MIARSVYPEVVKALSRQAAVALIGPRQVGKTTLALEIAAGREAVYLDLESLQDRGKLAHPTLFLAQNENRLVILDEIHRMPELFQTLRGVIDEGRRKGLGRGRFLILGSASFELLRQSETLAGRIAFIDMTPLNILEVTAGGSPDLVKLWLRGGFPDSFLAGSDEDSYDYRQHFIRTFLERDVPQFGLRIPAETLHRLWTMLAHSQGQCLNASKLAASLSVSAPSVGSYIDLLADLLLVRRLAPFHANVKKRLVKSPRVYVRDSGLIHALLGIATYNELAGHPVFGMSWEGFVIENLLQAVPSRTWPGFYRTSAGAEIDLVLEFPGGKKWAVEVKGSVAPVLTRGFHQAREDVEPERCFVVYPGADRYPLAEGIEVIGLAELTRELTQMAGSHGK